LAAGGEARAGARTPRNGDARRPAHAEGARPARATRLRQSGVSPALKPARAARWPGDRKLFQGGHHGDDGPRLEVRERGVLMERRDFLLGTGAVAVAGASRGAPDA